MSMMYVSTDNYCFGFSGQGLARVLNYVPPVPYGNYGVINY